MNERIDVQKAKLNLETAQIAWSELQRFFAKGNVIWVDGSLDLITVAHAIAEDDAKAVSHWMEDKQVLAVSDEQAKNWLATDSWMWSVVVRPLILVQEAD